MIYFLKHFKNDADAKAFVNELQINKLVIWIVATFLAGGSLMILIAKLFFEK